MPLSSQAFAIIMGKARDWNSSGCGGHLLPMTQNIRSSASQHGNFTSCFWVWQTRDAFCELSKNADTRVHFDNESEIKTLRLDRLIDRYRFRYQRSQPIHIPTNQLTGFRSPDRKKIAGAYTRNESCSAQPFISYGKIFRGCGQKATEEIHGTSTGSRLSVLASS